MADHWEEASSIEEILVEGFERAPRRMRNESGIMTEELTFEEWLLSTDEKRAELLVYGQSAIPTDIGLRQLDVSKAIEKGQDAGDLLADIEQYLILHTAKAVLDVRRDYSELNGDERKAVVKGRVAQVSRLRDGIHVLYSTIKDRRFALMNLNRS